MIDLNLFKQMIGNIKKALKSNDPFNIEIANHLIKCLEVIFNDNDKIINYWIHSEEKEKYVYINNIKHPILTVDRLYSYLTFKQVMNEKP